jgi:cobaltochelatase CobN
VETVKGEKPQMFISDTTKEIIQVDEVKKFIDRGVRTRLLNPKWIEGMLAHHYHGGQKITQRVEYLIGLASTTNKVDSWIWSEVSKRYIFDEKVRERLVENNRWATVKIVNRLLEANQRGYWKASQEELNRLKKIYLEIEGWVEEKL